MRYTIPGYLNDFVGDNLETYDNAYLLYHRVLDEDRRNKDRLKPFRHIDVIKKAMNCETINPGICEEQFDLLKQDRSLVLSGKQDFAINGRMVVGLGITSVSEVSMQLHHIYGIPYIPAQAIKGLVRSFVILELFEGDERKAENSIIFQNIFGISSDDNGTSKQGKVIFYDAYPCDTIKLRKDIMTSHHQQYYMNAELNDSEKTNPIKFLTIEDTKYRFLLGIKKIDCISEFEQDFSKDIISSGIELDGTNSKLLTVSIFWLKKALKYGGIGAKTAEGYGYFQCEDK